MNDRHFHEIVIVGAGLTGVMTALALSYCGYGSVTEPAIALVDRSDHQKGKPEAPISDNRTTTIHSAGKAMLSALGVWPLISNKATAIIRVKVAQGLPKRNSMSQRQSEFILSWDDDFMPMAYVIKNQDLLNALYHKLATRPVKLISGHTVTGFKLSGDCAHLRFDDRADLICQLVVACDGANSKIRDYANIDSIAEPHRQTAIVANLRLEYDHENTAFQRFLPTGPIALMPHGSNRASLVWSMPKDGAVKMQQLDSYEFSKQILNSFGDTLGGLQLDGPMFTWPLMPTLAKKMTSDHIVLAGDANHAIHPLAGQGYNLALSDAAVLADCLALAKKRGLNAGHQSIRKDYVVGRQFEVIAMATMTSGLNQLFSFHPTIAKIAGSGMSFINRSPWKSIFKKSATGGYLAQAALLRGNLPE